MTKLDRDKFGPWAIITGASSGIGKEFARQVAASGIHVVLVARRQDVLETVGQGLAQSFGVQYRVVAADLAREDFMEKMEAATQDLDIGLLVSNAGAGIPGAFLSVDEKFLRQIVHLNVTAHLRLTHRYGRQLAQRGRGGIVLVSAMGALQGIPYMANDAATKAYVISLGEGLHIEFEKLGINTTVVLPGPTDTPVLAKFGLDMASMPMKPMPVEQCVSEGLKALNANRSTHLTGRLNRIMMGLIPASIIRRINGKMLSSGLENGQPRVAHMLE